MNRIVVLLLLGLAACQPYEATAPEGFAVYDDPWEFRAVSPDGVIYRVRSEPNEPEADLAFWSEALKKRMTDAGYAFTADAEIAAGSEPGYLLELAAPVGQQDYTYAVALFVRQGDLVLVEVAGEVTRFAARRDAVLAAIEALR